VVVHRFLASAGANRNTGAARITGTFTGASHRGTPLA
jgi:hypothetical protein